MTMPDISTPAPGDDGLTATPDEARDELDHIRDDIELAGELPMTADPRRVVVVHAPRLLAAVEAALKEATEFEREAAAARKRARDHVARGDGYAAAFAEGTAEALKGCARTLREAITRALAGEEAGGG